MTNDRTTEPRDTLSDAMLLDAAAWHARLNDADANPAESAARRTEFNQWLQTDPRHPNAFAETDSLWRALEAPAADIVSRSTSGSGENRRGRKQGSPLRRRMAAVAACLFLAATVGVIGQDDLLLQLRSDHVSDVGERVPLALQDGSEITLNTDSAIAVSFGPDRRVVRLLKGQAWFDVVQDEDRPFHVETPVGAVHVTGTRFDVRLDGDTALVSLTKGRVALSTKPDVPESPPLVLTPGLQARVSANEISNATPFDKTAVTAWLRGQLVFYDTPLIQVVTELNRYRKGRIVVINEELETLRISGVFRTDDSELALSAIAGTLPLRIIRLTDYLVLLR